LDPRFVSDFLKPMNANDIFDLRLKDHECAALLDAGQGYRYLVRPLARDR